MNFISIDGLKPGPGKVYTIRDWMQSFIKNRSSNKTIDRFIPEYAVKARHRII